MFLTRMDLNPTRLTTKRMLVSPQVTHALVLGSIPPAPLSGGGRTLWRLDQDAHRLRLYVASPVRPDLTGVVEQAGWPTEPTWETRDYEPLLARLSDGETWRFRLTANPVRVVSRGEGARGRVSPHRTINHQLSWLLERSGKLGVDFPANSLGVPEVAVRGRGLATFRRRSAAGAGERVDRVALTTVTYEGVLRVVDPELLVAAMRSGIGRGKGYGCGLLTLAPHR
ncbi:MAG TPA: type I-E CRISPR-associated protein Cas6/Cse3/CasE [Dermatophilaceae bacterium]|nr:type I-E CRISPR-associated protein Cas6/Cse3/CasE [Dermatophilaceae bacterium]